jgi:hypothetical protein
MQNAHQPALPCWELVCAALFAFCLGRDGDRHRLCLVRLQRRAWRWH